MKEILLVEDDLLYSKIVSYILENNGFIVECASDGLQAIQMAFAKKYDLILADIVMPRATGLDLLSRIKKDETTKSTKVIIMSIFAGDYFMAESFSRGADEYLRKPLNAKDLLQAVRRLLYTKAA